MGFQALGLMNGHQRNAVGIAGRCNGLLRQTIVPLVQESGDVRRILVQEVQ